MDKETSELLLYENHGSKAMYQSKVHCRICGKIVCYCTDEIEVLEEISFVCKDCRGKLY